MARSRFTGLREAGSIGRFACGFVAGGAAGGALVGLAEVALILTTSAAPDEYWLVPYAIVSYGLLGIAAAVASIFAAGLIGRARSTVAAGLTLGVALEQARATIAAGRSLRDTEAGPGAADRRS